MSQPASVSVIRHLAFEDLGAFAPALERAGCHITYHDIGDTDLATLDPLAPGILIVLGGPIGADQERLYPFLRDELRLVEARLVAGKPLMGICLGAQIIARAAGARIFALPEKEIGFAPVHLTPAGELSCLAPFAGAPVTLHWHGDSFDLPGGADLLASTPACENQAFAIGPNIIGFQFHPEADTRRIEKWLVGHACELAAAGCDVARIRADAATYERELRAKAEAVLQGWLQRLAARQDIS